MNNFFKRWERGLGAASIVLGLLTLPSLALAEDCKRQALELPVTIIGQRAIVKLGINGTEVPMIVDSGAFFSFLTPAAAQSLDLKLRPLPWTFRVQGLTGDVDTKLTVVKHLQLRRGEIPDVAFIVGGNEPGAGAMGILGRNLLALADVEYDLAHGQIWLVFPSGDCRAEKLAYWAGDKPVRELPLERENDESAGPAIRALARLNGKELRVLFDTGAPKSSVSLDAAKSAGVSDMRAAGRVHGAGQGSAAAWTAAVGKFELAGEAFTDLRLFVEDYDLRNADMLLGIDFFLSHRIYISKKQHRMVFTYNGGPVFALNAANESQATPGDNPVDAEGYARRAATSAALRDFAHALADWNRACELAPEVADYVLRRGLVHQLMNQARLAADDFDAALQLDPTLTEARLQRAWMRADGRDRKGAMEDLQLLDKTMAPQAAQRNQMAAVYVKLGRLDMALLQWDLWINAHPKDVMLANVLNNRCWARTSNNAELDMALNDCNQAIELQPKEALFYNSRAWLRLRQGDLRLALADFERAVKLQPDIAWSLYGRGVVRRKLGDEAAGLADIEAARKLRPAIDAENSRYGFSAEQQAPPVPKQAPTPG